MRKSSLLVLLSLFVSPAFTKEMKDSKIRCYRHEINAQIGIASLSGNRWDTFRKQVEERFALSHKNGYAYHTIPIGGRMGLRYMYSFNKHFSIGGQFSYFTGGMDYDHYTKLEPIEIAPGIFVLERREHDNPPSIQAKAFNVLPTVKWLYSRWFYMRGGIGIQFRRYSMDATNIDASASPVSDRQWLFAYQIVPLGAEFPLLPDEVSIELFKKVSPIYFHVELGYGMEGILNIGLAYKFFRCESK